jgi:hypothetical protein
MENERNDKESCGSDDEREYEARGEKEWCVEQGAEHQRGDQEEE